MDKSFEFDGNKYRKASAHQKEWGNKIISELNLNGNERILDLGCGDGILTRQLASLVPNGYVLGIDSSQGMISTAMELESSNLSFRLLNINDIGFTNEFDLVFSNATLHWIHDHKRLIANVYKALKKNGVVRFNFAGDGNCMNFFTVIKKTMDLNKFRKYFNDFQWPWYMPSTEEYKMLVDGCSFKDIRVWEENADRYFPSRDDMIKWIDQPSIVPFLGRIELKHKEHFRELVIGEMIRRTEQEDGRCFETFRRINVFAMK